MIHIVSVKTFPITIIIDILKALYPCNFKTCDNRGNRPMNIFKPPLFIISNNGISTNFIWLSRPNEIENNRVDVFENLSDGFGNTES